MGDFWWPPVMEVRKRLSSWGVPKEELRGLNLQALYVRYGQEARKMMHKRKEVNV